MAKSSYERYSLHQPTALSVDSAGNVYFADQANHRIREILSRGR